MALTEDDVRRALFDPILQRMDFSVSSIDISGAKYTKIRELIEDKQVLVVPGTNPLRGEYDPLTDTITTKDIPADLIGRSHMIHECTHAIADMDYVTDTWLTGEAASRIAQATYLLLSDPSLADPRLDTPPGNGTPRQLPSLYEQFLRPAMDLAQKKELHTKPEVKTHVNQDDVLALIHKFGPAYDTKQASLLVNNGISAKVHIRPEPYEFPEHDMSNRMNAYKVPTDALFGFDRHDIDPKAEPPGLQQAADYIAKFKGPGQRVYITGHTDSKGDPGYNKGLSKQRADAVSQWLISHKFVEAADVITGGEGASKPVAPNKRPNGSDDPDGRAKNRRVEVLIM